MRVIAGTRRGFKLVSPKGAQTRPTADRIKESLFSIIARYIPGARVLDLFAGTGALGIEALSRGAAAAVFVDSSRAAADCIYKNLTHTGFSDKSFVHIQSANHYIMNTKDIFDIIFLDPPYDDKRALSVFPAVAARGLLSKNGIICFESASYDDDLKPEGFDILKRGIYNNTAISIFTAAEGGF